MRTITLEELCIIKSCRLQTLPRNSPPPSRWFLLTALAETPARRSKERARSFHAGVIAMTVESLTVPATNLLLPPPQI